MPADAPVMSTRPTLWPSMTSGSSLILVRVAIVVLRSGEDVGDVASGLALDPVHPGLGLLGADSRCLLVDAHERLPHGGRHVAAVAADEDAGAATEQIGDVGAVLPDAVLNEHHVALRLLVERRPHADDAGRLPRRELVAIEKVDIRVVAAEEEQRRADAAPVLRLCRALLQEAAERREPGAGAYHHHRRLR